MKIRAKRGFFVKRFFNKETKIERNGKEITILDGHFLENDILICDDELGTKLCNTLYDEENVAEEIEETNNQEDENVNTEEETEETDNQEDENVNTEEETEETNNQEDNKSQNKNNKKGKKNS